MKFYLARLKREFPCGSKKFLEYYFKHKSLAAARRKVAERYPNWRVLSVKAVGNCISC